MGGGASVVRKSAKPKISSSSSGQPSRVQTPIVEAASIMASLQDLTPKDECQEDESTKMIHVIDISSGSFPDALPDRIECDDIVEFKTKGKNELDVYEVYKDGDDYYLAMNGYILRNIKSRTPENERRLIFPFSLTQPSLDLYFCIIPSSERQAIETTRKCPKNHCENNILKIQKAELKFTLTDEKENQKVFIRKGESVEIVWATIHNSGYRIEEKNYCPVSGGLYAVERTSENVSTRYSSIGKFTKTFNDLGMSYLCRMNDKNQIHDITICIVHETYQVKHIDIDDDKIQPNIIWVQQNDWIRFAWQGKRKQTVVQIEPFTISETKQQSIELKTSGEHFFWPHKPSRHGCMYYQFSQTGMFCFKTEDNRIGTIVVEPRISIRSIDISSGVFTHQINTHGFIRFNWKFNNSSEESVFITMDSNSSVAPDIAGGLAGVFDCALHKCIKADSVFRHHFNTCETYLLKVPQHGLYNFAYSDEHDRPLISVIVENDVDNHRVTYDEYNTFEPNPLIINRFDQVWFDSSSEKVANIYETDEFGNPLESEKPLFQPQPKSINYYMKEFPKLGIYYFSTDINSNNKKKKVQSSTRPLAIIVIPEIKFHYKSVGKNTFDVEPTVTSTYDFVIWQFDDIICHQSVELKSIKTSAELKDCHERALIGRKRMCLAVECNVPGTFFFANPDFERFERFNSSNENPLLSTIIIDPPFSQNSFITTGNGFVPDVLYISENDTISWTLARNERNHAIFVHTGDIDDDDINEDYFVDLHINQYVPTVHHLHTFRYEGKYTIRSNRFNSTATVFVYPETTIRSEKRYLQEPRITEDIYFVSEFGKQIHLSCPNKTASIYYTVDGATPTRRYDNVYTYNLNEGLLLTEPGLNVIRAYSVQNERISSAVIASGPTFVTEDKERERLKKLLQDWNDIKIKLSVSLENPNKIFGTIIIQPDTAADLIDHFELCVNDTPHNLSIQPDTLQFSAEGFAGGERYEVCTVAYPKDDLQHAEPISSNKREFTIQREIRGGGPLLSLAVSNDRSTILLMWSHIGNHVIEYVVYVNDVETKIITQKDFNDFYGIHFHGAQHHKRYAFRVEAKTIDGTETLKSNLIDVDIPLNSSVKEAVIDRYFAFLTINGEKMPSGNNLEEVLDQVSSSKLSIKSSSPPSSSRSSAASSRPSIDMIDLNSPPLTSSNIIHDQKDDRDNDNYKASNIKEKKQAQQRKLPGSKDAVNMQTKFAEKTESVIRAKSKGREQDENCILSEDAKRRAQELFRKLTEDIENRSRGRKINSKQSSNLLLTVQQDNDDESLSGDYQHKTIGLRNVVPEISYRHNPDGIALLWKRTSPTLNDHTRNYRIIVNNKQYGKLIDADAEPKFQINLSPAKYTCYVEVLPKDENDEILKSNTIKINIPSDNGLQYERRKPKESLDTHSSTLKQEDAPIPKLIVEKTSASSICVRRYLDRPMPNHVFDAFYEVHIRGHDFPEHISSDEKFETDGYIEHVWYVVANPLDIEGISAGREYTIFLRALFHVFGSSDMNYIATKSNEILTSTISASGSIFPPPLLKLVNIGLQKATLSWKLDDSFDESLVKGYSIIQNSKPTEFLPPTQNEYELCNLRSGTSHDIQVSIMSNHDFANETLSNSISILCPKRPQPPVIQAVLAEQPFSIRIKWTINDGDQDEITSFKLFLNGKPYDTVKTDGRQSFQYDFTKLRAEQTHTIYIKSCIEHKKIDGNTYQCEIESNASNELLSKCAAPPKGTIPRIERMTPTGIELMWEPPVECGDVKLIGYQILKNGRAVEKSLPVDKRKVLITDIEEGNRYSFQVLPLTNQPGGILIRTGEEYDPDRHGHYLPGPKLEVEYTDLVLAPKKIWVENITGRSAMICWSPIDESTTSHKQPDNYLLSIWNDSDLKSDKPMIVTLPKEKLFAHLNDLQSKTTYKIQLEAIKRRRHHISNDLYIVSRNSEILTFKTGRPPDIPSNFYLIACTNTDARFGFNPFIEHNAEIVALRVNYKATNIETNAREILMDIKPDSNEFILSNLSERTNYEVTIYAITEEYLYEKRCRDFSQLPLKLEPSEWLLSISLPFQTSGWEPVSKINILRATTEAIELEWTLPKVYGSTKYISQALRWKSEHGGDERRIELDPNKKKHTIKERLPSGLYKISLDSYFSVKINLEDDYNETSRKETCLTTNETVTIHFHAPITCESPEIFLTGYTRDTIDLEWSKPDMFSIVDHPEKLNEQLKIHRQLLEYRVEINGKQKQILDESQRKCTLTECQPDEQLKIQLYLKTIVQNQDTNNMIINCDEEPDEISSMPFYFHMLKTRDLLSSFRANFEFNRYESNTYTTSQHNQNKILGQINIKWEVLDSNNISNYILQWRSSKDLFLHEKYVKKEETSATIDSCDEKHFYTIGIIIVTNNNSRFEYEKLIIPIPGEPDAPSLWLVKTSDTNFIVEWSEPKSYGIPVIGYQLYVEGKKKGDVIQVHARRAEIPSRINRTYQVTVCAVTNNALRSHSPMSSTLSVITTPTTNLIPTTYYDDGSLTSFDRSVARIIPLKIEPINEEKLHIDWTSFLPTDDIRTYYIHYTCLNNSEIKTMKVSKRFRYFVLRDLRPGFTYAIMVMAVNKNGGVLYISDKNTIQMNAPPNAPIVAISERTTNHVKFEWRPAASYGEIAVVGYKIYVNNHLAAIVAHDKLSYTLTKGLPCEIYTVHVQAMSNDKHILSPMSRSITFAWPGIKPGAFKRVDDGQTGAILVSWEHPQLEDETEALLGYKIYSENIITHAVRLHGDYDAATTQAAIHDLNSGEFRVWLEIQSEHHCVRARPITVVTSRFSSLRSRPLSSDAYKCIVKKQKRFRSPAVHVMIPSLRHTQYS